MVKQYKLENEQAADPDFSTKIQALKTIFNVRTDMELGKELGISQQAVSQAKKRKCIPNSWIKNLRAQGLYDEFLALVKKIIATEKDYSFLKYENRFERSFLKIFPEILADHRGNKVDEESFTWAGNLGRYFDPSRGRGLRRFVAAGMVLLAAKYCKFMPNRDQAELLELYVLKEILNRGVEKIMGYIEELKNSHGSNGAILTDDESGAILSDDESIK